MSVLPSNGTTVLTFGFRDATASTYPEHPMCPLLAGTHRAARAARRREMQS
jgi:hypothetical protein